MYNMLNYNKTILKKISISNILSKFKIFLLILIAFRTMEPYVFWGKGFLTITIILLLIGVQLTQFFLESKPTRFNYTKFVLLCISYGIFYIYKNIFWSISIIEIFITFLTVFVPVFVLIICSDEEKKSFLTMFTTFISIVLLLSLVEYFLVVFGILHIKPVKIYFPDNKFYKFFDNYGLFIVVFDLRNYFIPRFQSVFTEPGHLGMMCSLILYANAYKLKDKRVLIVFISTLLSMSLASYILLFAGIFLYKFCVSKKKLLMAIGLVVTAILLVTTAVIYYEAFPESEFSTAIIGRLMPDEKRGIQGNNRTTPAFKKAFAEQMSEFDRDALLGYGSKALNERLPGTGGNSSASCFIFMFGIVGGFLLAFFYLQIILTNYSNAIIGMLVLYFLSFLQRPYATWFAQISLMICASIQFRENYLYDFKKKFLGGGETKHVEINY